MPWIIGSLSLMHWEQNNGKILMVEMEMITSQALCRIQLEVIYFPDLQRQESAEIKVKFHAAPMITGWYAPIRLATSCGIKLLAVPKMITQEVSFKRVMADTSSA